MFEQITVIGMGLIGSSLAHAVNLHSLADKIIAADKSEDVCGRVVKLGFAHEVTSDIASSVKGSDLVILCVPVGAYDDVGAAIHASLKPGAIVSDVGSVKQAVIDVMSHHIPESVHFVPGHPIAGTEHSGPEAGFAALFDKRWCILTPLPQGDIKAVEKLTEFWEACGSNVEIQDAAHHDLILGITSHLPHLIAYSIVDTACELENDIRSEVIKYSAGGFRDFTRIAASNPVMWRDVFLHNRESVLEILQRFTEDLTALQKAIRRGDGDYLFEVFSRTRDIRRAIVDQGQAD